MQSEELDHALRILTDWGASCLDTQARDSLFQVLIDSSDESELATLQKTLFEARRQLERDRFFSGYPVNNDADLTYEEMKLMVQGKIIPAIKSIRTRTGLNLREAKGQADQWKLDNPGYKDWKDIATDKDRIFTGSSINNNAELTYEEMKLMVRGRMISAIKSIRTRKGLNLRECKRQADQWKRDNPGYEDWKDSALF